ncbi:recombinase family protein [Pantoea agglomerans]|uniref:recombinase family protein n=1 Tax=Enterobacter agglomerans TaxID=549 RepID=UPI003C7A482B
MKAYLYSRISTLQQADGFGIERQIQSVTDFLQYAQIDPRLGYQLDPNNYEVLASDLGKSAFKGDNWKITSNLGRFYDDVMNNRITSGVLVVENIDRLTRLSNYEAANKLSSLITRGIDILEVESTMCFSNKIPESMTVLNMSISRAYGESLRKSRMAGKSWDNRRNQLKTEGKAIVNNLPQWLDIIDRQYVPNDLASTFNLIFKMYAEGYGVAAIVDHLNSNVPRLNDLPWSNVIVYRALRDKRFIGLKTSGKAKTVIRMYPEVVDPVLFQLVQDKMDSNAQSEVRKTTKHQRNIFNGITRCGFCGEALIVDRNGHGNYFLVCLGRRHKKGCTAPNVPYEFVERELLQHANGISFEEAEPEDTTLRDQARMIGSQIEELELELKTADDDSVLAIVRVLKNKKLKKKEIDTVLAAMPLQASNVVFDIEVLTNQDNVKQRQAANVMIKKVIQKIIITRHDYTVYIELSYHNPYFRHTLILNAKERRLVGKASIDENALMDLGFMKVDLLTGEVTKVREFTNDDLEISQNYKEFIELVLEKVEQRLS